MNLIKRIFPSYFPIPADRALDKLCAAWEKELIAANLRLIDAQQYSRSASEKLTYLNREKADLCKRSAVPSSEESIPEKTSPDSLLIKSKLSALIEEDHTR